MSMYEFFFLFSFVLLFSSLIKPDYQKYPLIILSSILFFFAGFRELTVGTDTLSYEIWFNMLSSGNTLHTEPAWIGLNNLIIAQFGSHSYPYFVTLVSAITIYPLVYMFYKYSDNPLFSLFTYYTLYIYFFCMNGMRQGIALTMVFVAICLDLDNKRLLSLLFLAVAASFHLSALTALPLLLCRYIPEKKLFYFFTIIISLIVGFFASSLLSPIAFLLDYGSYLSQLVPDAAEKKLLFLIVFNAFFVFFIYTTDCKSPIFKMYYLLVVSTNLLINIPLGARIRYYYMVPLFLFLPKIVQTRKKDKLAFSLIIVLFVYFFFVRPYGTSGIFPYSNRLI